MKPTKSINLPSWMPEALRGDPKKAGLLLVLISILLVLAIRMSFSSGPAIAQASISTGTSTGNVLPTKKSTKSELTQATTSTRSWLKEPIKSVNRDLFSVNYLEYKTIVTKPPAKQQTEVDNLLQQQEKLRAEQADQKRRRDAYIANLQHEVEKFRLQSTLMGTEPNAMIDNKLVKTGESVKAGTDESPIVFRIEKIESQRVVIEHEGIRFVLHMKQ